MLISCADCGVPAAGRIRISAAATLVAVFLSGCAAIAPYDSARVPFDVPTAWSGGIASAADGTNPVAQWWLRFNDPLLASLIAEAMQANTSVTTAQAALRQARALRDVAGAALLPGVSGSGSGRHGTSGGKSTGNSFNAGLDASWEVDLFGANRNAFNASEFDARASAASLADTQVSIAAETALAYITRRSGQARLAIANANLAIQLETLQITQWRLQAGLVTEVEAEQARTSAEQTRAQLPALQTAIEQARNALGVLVGRPPMALAAALATPGPVPQANNDLALSLPA